MILVKSMKGKYTIPYMSSHVFQTFVQTCEHVGEFLAPNKVASSGCIESPGNWLEIAVVL